MFQAKKLLHLLSGTRFTMSIPGTEIFRCYDNLGPIRVFEEGSIRYLAFSEDSQQSAIDLSRPSDLVFEYTQAMLLALVYLPSPKRITLLGLGAGSLVHAFRQYSKHLLIDAVELRPQVIKVAQDWFELPSEDDRLNVFPEDAEQYMSGLRGETDLILADVYNDDGMEDLQLCPSFLRDCFNALSQNGVLVLNLWDQGKGSHPKAKRALQENFDENCLACSIGGDNLIVLAFKGGMPQINDRHLQPLIKKISKRLPFSVSKFAGRLKEL
jgi:spermidine synthase